MRTVTVPLTVAKTATGARILEGFSAFRDRAVAGSRVRYRRAGRAQALAGASDASRTAPWAGGAERRHTGATFSVSARVARGSSVYRVGCDKLRMSVRRGPARDGSVRSRVPSDDALHPAVRVGGAPALDVHEGLPQRGGHLAGTAVAHDELAVPRPDGADGRDDRGRTARERLPQPPAGRVGAPLGVRVRLLAHLGAAGGGERQDRIPRDAGEGRAGQRRR